MLGDDGTVREALERHRDDPTCASCHALLDVLGMGFEQFDGIGRVRPDPDLDALGELPDGTTEAYGIEGTFGLDGARFGDDGHAVISGILT